MVFNVTGRGAMILAAAASTMVSATASADTLTLSQAVSGSSGTLSNSDITVNIPDFSASLGTLTGLSLTFSGTLSDEVVFESGSPAGTFTANNNAGLAGAGFLPTTVYSLAPSTFTLSLGQVMATAPSVGVSFTANAQASALSMYQTGLPPGYETTALFFGFSLTDMSGYKVYASDAESTFNGRVIETYTYTPINEPGTMPILAMSVLGLCAARRRSSRAT